MPTLQCPQCRTLVQRIEGQAPVCPQCGYGSQTTAAPTTPPPVQTPPPTQASTYQAASGYGGPPNYQAAPQPQPGYAPQAYTQAYAAPKQDGMIIGGYICGGLAFLFLPIILGPIAITLGAVAKSKGDERGTGVLIVGILGLIIGMLFGVLMFL